MNRKTINLMIPFLTLIIFFVWGWIEGSYQHSWLIFIVSGMVYAILPTLGKGKEKEKSDKDEAKDRDEQ